ncbi:MAG: ribonuclease III [cyanobacterium endosymbiont of Rhopalodia musculus]|uniref:ribonuclease III n=1 Tax=cyanobacterium endosymbiont of Epithemia clementina EcSB TaxID=3034674 RepID=UPI0024813663|nr:ribonuclease III [cyanobacterium endosymbiont of Epithemia clementina EcSB]WGT67480.1 ribonuclease III [cyanobacterium endosymbiont of Epithemia clementina EcSB]
MTIFLRFKNQALLDCALTHRSYVNEHRDVTEHNERLEFLGDAVLQFVVSEELYRRHPELNEAQLTRLRSKLVDEPQLAQFAKVLDLGEFMYLGQGAIKDGGQKNPALLSDTFEAIIGAYFLDAGIEAVQRFVRSLFKDAIDTLIIPESKKVSSKIIDVKNRLQEWALANYKKVPKYFLIEELGPDHAKEFIFGVQINKQLLGTGKGRRKQEATKAAAQDALNKLSIFDELR